MFATIPNLDHLSPSSSCSESCSSSESSLLSKPRTIIGQYWSSVEGDSKKQGSYGSFREHLTSNSSGFCIPSTIETSSSSFSARSSSMKKSYSPSAVDSLNATGKSQLTFVKGKEEKNADLLRTETIISGENCSPQLLKLGTFEICEKSSIKDSRRVKETPLQRRPIFSSSAFSKQSLLSFCKARSAPSLPTNTKMSRNLDLRLRSSIRSKKSCSQPNLRTSVSFNPNVQVVEYEKWEPVHENEGWWRMFIYAVQIY